MASAKLPQIALTCEQLNVCQRSRTRKLRLIQAEPLCIEDLFSGHYSPFLA
jgi:hypothetical protein